MKLDELRDKVLSEVEGLDEWEVKEVNGSICMYLFSAELGHFNPFSTRNPAIEVYPGSGSEYIWCTDVSYKTGLNPSKYKTTSGLIRQIRKGVKNSNIEFDQRKAAHAKHTLGIEDQLVKLAPYIEEYGEIFEVHSPESVIVKYAGFMYPVQLEDETVNMSNDLWTPHYVPMHMAIPFMREVELFRLLE